MQIYEYHFWIISRPKDDLRFLLDINITINPKQKVASEHVTLRTLSEVEFQMNLEFASSLTAC